MLGYIFPLKRLTEKRHAAPFVGIIANDDDDVGTIAQDARASSVCKA